MNGIVCARVLFVTLDVDFSCIFAAFAEITPAALNIASVQIGTALVAALVPITTTPFDIAFAKSTPALFAIPFASAVQGRTVVLAIVIMIDGTQWR